MSANIEDVMHITTVVNKCIQCGRPLFFGHDCFDLSSGQPSPPEPVSLRSEFPDRESSRTQEMPDSPQKADSRIPDREPTAFKSILAEMEALHDKKQQDYGKDADPFANVRASEDFGIPGWHGCLIRANDKMRRLQTFCQKGTLANEGVEDSLLDLAVYSVIALVLWREKHPPEPPQFDAKAAAETIRKCVQDAAASTERMAKRLREGQPG